MKWVILIPGLEKLSLTSKNNVTGFFDDTLCSVSAGLYLGQVSRQICTVCCRDTTLPVGKCHASPDPMAGNCFVPVGNYGSSLADFLALYPHACLPSTLHREAASEGKESKRPNGLFTNRLSWRRSAKKSYKRNSIYDAPITRKRTTTILSLCPHVFTCLTKHTARKNNGPCSYDVANISAGMREGYYVSTYSETCP